MLKYIGDGAWLPGIPARDLSDREVQQYGEELLLRSKLYSKEDAAAVTGPEPAEHEVNDGSR